MKLSALKKQIVLVERLMLINQMVQWSEGPQVFYTEGLQCKESFEQPVQLERVLELNDL